MRVPARASSANVATDLSRCRRAPGTREHPLRRTQIRVYGAFSRALRSCREAVRNPATTVLTNTCHRRGATTRARHRLEDPPGRRHVPPRARVATTATRSSERTANPASLRARFFGDDLQMNVGEAGDLLHGQEESKRTVVDLSDLHEP